MRPAAAVLSRNESFGRNSAYKPLWAVIDLTAALEAEEMVSGCDVTHIAEINFVLAGALLMMGAFRAHTEAIRVSGRFAPDVSSLVERCDVAIAAPRSCGS